MNVLITGGSEGIGLELAKLFAKDGHHIYIAARRKETLLAAKKEIAAVCAAEKAPPADGRIHLLPVDLCQPDAAEEVYRWSGPVDVLINNAGMGTVGSSWELDPAVEQRLLQLNVEALVLLCRRYLTEMIAAGKGTILNIGSTAAFQPGPYAASYYASKAFVVSYSRALHEEAKPYGVEICCYCPGPVKTAFYDKEGVKPTIGAVSPAVAAKNLYQANWKKAVIVPGVGNKLMRLLPSGLRMKAVGHMKKKIIR